MNECWNLCNLYEQKTNWERDRDMFKLWVETDFVFDIQSLESNIVPLVHQIEDGYIKLDKLYGYANLLYYADMSEHNMNNISEINVLYGIFEEKIDCITEWVANNEVKLAKDTDLAFILDMFNSEEENKTANLTRFESQLFLEDSLRHKIYKDGNIGEFEDNELVIINESNHLSLLMSHNRAIRRKTYDAVLTFLEKKADFAAVIFNTHFQLYTYIACEHDLMNAFEYSLFVRNITLDTYKKWGDCIDKNIDLFHQFIEYKKILLKQNQISYSDLYVFPFPDSNMYITIEEAKKNIMSALEPLGFEYRKIVNRLFEERYIDWLPRKNKRTGGFSWEVHDELPYILINWEYNIDSLFSLIHEIGGAVAGYFSSKGDQSIFKKENVLMDEVASIVNELLLLEYLKKTNKNFAQYLYLDKMRELIFNTYQFLEFEEMLAHLSEHRNLTSKDISESYRSGLQKYYNLDCFEEKKSNEINWVRSFNVLKKAYCFEYIRAVSFAQTIVENMLCDSTLSTKYIFFLTAKNCDNLTRFKNINIDIYSIKYLENIFETMKNLLIEQANEKIKHYG